MLAEILLKRLYAAHEIIHGMVRRNLSSVADLGYRVAAMDRREMG